MSDITIERVPFEALGNEWHGLVVDGYHAAYAGIYELYDQLGTAESKIDRMHRWGRGLIAWTARDDGRLVGLLSGDVNGGRLIIYDLFVARAYRRQGIARALLATALAEPGLREVGTEINADNLASRALFESLGFAPAATIHWYTLEQ